MRIHLRVLQFLEDTFENFLCTVRTDIRVGRAAPIPNVNVEFDKDVVVPISHISGTGEVKAIIALFKFLPAFVAGMLYCYVFDFCHIVLVRMLYYTDLSYIAVGTYISETISPYRILLDEIGSIPVSVPWQGEGRRSL